MNERIKKIFSVVYIWFSVLWAVFVFGLYYKDHIAAVIRRLFFIRI